MNDAAPPATGLAAVVAVSAATARTRARRQKIAGLAALLRALPADEVALATACLAGSIPGGPVGVGPAAVDAVRAAPPAAAPALGLAEFAARLDALRALHGAGAAARRRAALGALFARATALEQDFIARLLLGELRHGALEGLLTDAVAEAAGVAPERVRRAAMLAGELPRVAAAALAAGDAGLDRFALTLYVPVLPMLASPVDGAAEALTALGEAAFEYKLDGVRVQVHKGPDGVRVFTRRLHEVGAGLPEIVAAVAALPARELVLDGEVLALDAAGRPRPFQQTMARFGTRTGVAAASAAVPLSLYCFDCLQIDGEPLLDRGGAERAAALAAAVPPALRVAREVIAAPAAAAAFVAAALAAGHEGAMAKSLDAPYAAGSRGAGWLKIKPARTLDLVVLAAEWGTGRRQGRLSNLHLGAREPGGGFVMLGKTFKGLTDAMLDWQTARLKALAVARAGPVVHVRPELVVEIAFNELQASPRYPAGLALRFARVVRYRADKRAAEADTIDTVRSLFAAQRGG